jgi:mediator of DNA damage checkpoint protein 1
MKSTPVRASSVQTCGLAEAHGIISVNITHEEKQKGSNNGMHLLPKFVENPSCSTSFRDLPDCGIDSDSHGYVQNHDKEGAKGRDKCSTAKKLFADMMAEDSENNSKCFAGLSYIGSQEPGGLSQANAFEVVDRLISINDGLSSEETTPIKKEMAKPHVSNKTGTLILADKVNLSRSSNGKTEIFEWVDSREDDGGGEFFSKNKEILLKKTTVRGKQKSVSARENKCSVKVASATNEIGEYKDTTNSKLRERFEAIPLSDSRLLKIDVKSKRASGNRTKKNLLKDLDNLSHAKSLEREQEKDDVAVPDVGPDTQMAVEAMEALAQCSPAETLPAKSQPQLDRVMTDAERKTVTSESKNGPLQKRTSSVQEGVTTRSKRRKVPELNPKPRKDILKELKMQENSELIMVKTKQKQTKSVPEKGKVLNMFPDENKYHGTPVAHCTRHSGRKNVCEHTELRPNKRSRKGNRETGDCSSNGEEQNNHITNGDEKQIHCERVSKSASLYFEKEGTKHACANSTQNHQSSRGGTTKLNRVNNFQNLEACRGEETTDVACREPPSHPKQGRTPTRMVQSKVTAITQTAAGHEVPPEVSRQSKKRRVFVCSVSDLLKYTKREPSSGRSTSMLSRIIGKSLADSPILSSSVRVDSKTSGFSASVQRMKEPPHVENSSKSPENKAQDTDNPLKTPSKVVNDLSPTFSPLNPSKGSGRSLPKSSIARELLKLDHEKTLSNQRGKYSRKRKDMASFSILFSHHLDENVIKRQKKVTVFLFSTLYHKLL